MSLILSPVIAVPLLAYVGKLKTLEEIKRKCEIDKSKEAGLECALVQFSCLLPA